MKTLSPGDRIGEYEVDGFVASGGFGSVWKAHHRAWPDQIVAVKVPREGMDLAALRREGDSQKRVEHPGVVRCLGMDLDADPPYVLMEYVPGGNLRDYLKSKGKLPWQEAVRLAAGILQVLDAAHSMGVLHLDIKPENVLLDDEKRPKLSDFGLSRSVSELETSLRLSTEGAGQIAGTLLYMAPEQRRGESAGPETDLFAVGAVLYEMLTGEAPQGSDVLTDLAPDAPKGLDAVFRKSYCRRERRYKSAKAMLGDLETVYLSGSGPKPPPLPPPLPEPVHESPSARSARVVRERLTGPPRPWQPMPYPVEIPGAGLPVRIVAFFLDIVLMGIFGALIGVASVKTVGRLNADGGAGVLAFLVYRTLSQAIFGATLGQLACGLAVADRSGQKAQFWQIFLRNLLVYPSLFVLGPVVALFSRGRALHDYLAGTRVIETSSLN